ncbi:TetR family transcriptional regulator [uncultured Parolsenella sp.]|uniref:TetR/AcrR family transcriptional regulator n=1 Tax=uncultured Parolsenella sp. TaxID=2083008 RepID=UPI0027D9BABE|nr:TetR family transcriptional regulator [uncultured Parolsenella sp.]
MGRTTKQVSSTRGKAGKCPSEDAEQPRQPRVVKQPDQRKQEILDAAMGLFTTSGYDSVSMRDIARAAEITPGLVYHYFDSKQNLFSAAFDAYVIECTRALVAVLDDQDVELSHKLDVLFSQPADEESQRYHAFFHAKGNRMFHDHLSFAICQRLYPHVLAAIRSDARARGVVVRNSETLVDFIIHGQLNLMSAHDARVPERLDLIRKYVQILLDSQTVPASSAEAVGAEG